MLALQAFRVEQKEKGDASLSPGDRQELKPINEFGAKPYTEDEKISLSEIVKSFNERHGTELTEADILRLEQVNQDILEPDMVEMIRNNPQDVVYSAYSQTFFQGLIRMFQRENEMKNIILADADVREKATKHFFGRALREVRERATPLSKL